MPAQPAEMEAQPMTATAGTLGDLVLTGSLRVPLNQRPWSWKNSNLDDLVSDLVETTDRCSKVGSDGRWAEREWPTGQGPLPHFFGPVVLEQTGTTREVVDGQQRLTAVAILVAMMRDINEAFCSGPPSETRELSLRLRVGLESWLSDAPTTGQGGPRLLLDATIHDFFTSYVIGCRSEDERATQRASDPLEGVGRDPVRTSIETATTRLRALLDEALKLSDAARPPDVQVVTHLAEMFRVLRDVFSVITVTVQRRGFSPQLFRGLNARGVSLTEADKIKNELFIAEPERDYETIKEHWDRMVTAAPGRDLETFLRSRFIVAHGMVKERDLYAATKSADLHVRSVTTVKEWADDAQLAQITYGATAHQNVSEQARRDLLNIVNRKHTYLRPLLLAAAKRFLASDGPSFETAVRLIRNLGFRELSVRGRNAETVLEATVSICHQLVGGDSLHGVAASMAAMSPDRSFEDKFATFYAPKADMQYYVLYELSLAAAGTSRAWLPPAPQSGGYGKPVANVEHILPQNPSKTRIDEFAAWRTASDPSQKDDELVRSYLHRIGNLLLIEDDLNGELSDYDFVAKSTGQYPESAVFLRRAGNPRRRSYLDSQSQLAQDVVAGYGGSPWLPECIERRSRELARHALIAWTLEVPRAGRARRTRTTR